MTGTFMQNRPTASARRARTGDRSPDYEDVEMKSRSDGSAI